MTAKFPMRFCTVHRAEIIHDWTQYTPDAICTKEGTLRDHGHEPSENTKCKWANYVVEDVSPPDVTYPASLRANDVVTITGPPTALTYRYLNAAKTTELSADVDPQVRAYVERTDEMLAETKRKLRQEVELQRLAGIGMIPWYQHTSPDLSEDQSAIEGGMSG